MGGVKGKRGERTVLSPPEGIGVKMQRAALSIAEAERCKLDTSEFAVRILVLGTQEVLRCPSCVAGVPCKRHGAEAYKAALLELGLADAPNTEPVDPNGENRQLSDLWIARWQARYGRKPNLNVKHFVRLAAARLEHGFELLHDAIEGVFASKFHTETTRPNLMKVLDNPSEFATYKGAQKGRGTLQGGADTWGGG